MVWRYSQVMKSHWAVAILAAICVFAPLGSGASSAKASEGVPMPDRNTAVSLIYETIIAVNNASHTGNFSVLRGLGAPEFQSRFRDEDLSQAFRALRQKDIDLRPVVLLTPVIEKSQYFGSKNLFRLKGFMPTLPVRLKFEIHYQFVEKKWRLYTLKLDFRDVHPSQRKKLVANPGI